jgi:autotransporter-associated beta strand protein
MKSMKPHAHLGRNVTVGAVALALTILSASSVSAEVIAGWDTWDSGVSPTASVVAAGITASAATTSEGPAWHTTDERGASNDGDWGTSLGPPFADTTVGTGNDQNLELTNATTGGTITITITNNGGSDINLDAFHFDAYAFRPKAARAYELSVLPGGALSEGIIYTSADDEITHVGGAWNNGAHDDIDHDLTGLADSTLEVGGTVEFLLAFSSGVGDGSGGHDLWVDNVAVTSAPTTTNKLVITTVPASATAGVDFSVIVQAQDSGGTPINVAADTEFSLTSTGTGVLSGATGTILAGTNSVTLTTVQSTVAEDITLIALGTSGDDLLPSAPSSPITIIAGPATQIVIETAADGSGTAVGDTLLIIGEELDVFAISRDAVGNFVANETDAVFTLVNITENVTEGDLLDYGDGSANYLAQDTGTCNIRAAVDGFPDADSGLITAAELSATWDRTGTNSNWSTAANWRGDVLPDFDNRTDLIFYDPSAVGGSSASIYLGADRTARSLTYNASADANFNIRTTIGGTTGAADLFLDTDSTEVPAEIHVDAEADGNFKIGNVSSPANEYGDVVLLDDLLVNHNGGGTLTIDTVISELDGSYGITKAGPGTLVLSGTNSYTGDTMVDAGTLLINGDHTGATGAIAVNNGATLGGTGIIGGTVTVASDASIAPGTMAGTLTMDGDLDISALAGGAGTLDIGLAALVDSSDSIEVNGDLVIGSGVLGLGDINITDLGGLEAGSYTLISSNSGLVGTLDPADLMGSIAPGFAGELQIQDFSIVLIVTGGAPGDGIVITDITKGGPDVTLTFTSSGNVDVYRSTDLQSWGAAPYAAGQASPYTDNAASGLQQYYILVPAGDPAP